MAYSTNPIVALVLSFFSFLMGKLFMSGVNTAVTSVYPDYDFDKIVTKAGQLKNTLEAKAFADKYSCNDDLVIQLIKAKTIKGYEKDGIWFVSSEHDIDL